MTFRNRYLFIVFILVTIVGLVFQWKQHYKSLDSYDYPKELSGNKESILVRKEKRYCECPEWSLKQEANDSSEKTFIYLQPATSNLSIPQNLDSLQALGYWVKLEGQYYKGEAIPQGYEQKTEDKPEKAMVFYYSSLQIIKQD